MSVRKVDEDPYRWELGWKEGDVSNERGERGGGEEDKEDICGERCGGERVRVEGEVICCVI